MELSVRLQVNRVAGTERHQLDLSSEPIDDSETSDPIAAKALKLALERLAGVRVFDNRLERGPDFALEHGMKAADERRDLVRNSQTVWQ